MIAQLLQDSFRRPAVSKEATAACRLSGNNKQINDWTLEHLNIQPYQHIMEIGYGSGNILQEVARKLKVGFLAGLDPSPVLYRQAYRKNRRFIEQQLLQLHIGALPELSYPAHYFHTIYGVNAHCDWKEPSIEFMRLAAMLKSRGRLVMVFQPRVARNQEALQQAAEKIQADYAEAGLTEFRIEYRSTYPNTYLAAIGIKA